MNSYYNGLITNEEVIKELLETAKEITDLYKKGEQLGLSPEELAFYDALTKPEHIKDFYEKMETGSSSHALSDGSVDYDNDSRCQDKEKAAER